jgi:AhpD family alkylhydroperoxidase
MDKTTKELAAIAASVSAHCCSCLQHYLNVARALRIPVEDIEKAVQLAGIVCGKGNENMAKVANDLLKEMRERESCWMRDDCGALRQALNRRGFCSSQRTTRRSALFPAITRMNDSFLVFPTGERRGSGYSDKGNVAVRGSCSARRPSKVLLSRSQPIRPIPGWLFENQSEGSVHGRDKRPEDAPSMPVVMKIGEGSAC